MTSGDPCGRRFFVCDDHVHVVDPLFPRSFACDEFSSENYPAAIFLTSFSRENLVMSVVIRGSLLRHLHIQHLKHPKLKEDGMLGEKNAIATVAVKEIGVAKKFYEGVLGLKPRPTQEPSVAEYQSGNAEVMVYESKYAGTNQATAVTWFVDQLEKLVQTLKAKGVVFEHYDFPGMTRQGDVHLAGKLKNAWFKDPDGNILSLVSQ